MTIETAKLDGKPTTIHLHMKHNDCVAFTVENEKGEEILDMHSDYLPTVGILGGDDTTLRIDNATGKIIGWKPVTNDELHEFLSDAGYFEED